MNRSQIAALSILILLSVWMASGLFTSQNEQDSENTEAAQPSLTKVQVLKSTARSVQRLVRVQGQVEAARVLQLKSEIEGQVEQLPAVEGQRVQAADVLVALAADYRPAQVEQMKARVRQWESELSASEKLFKRGLGSENDVIRLQAELASARANLEQMAFQLAHTQIQAPFDAVLNRLQVELGDYVDKAQVVAELVDDSELLVTGQVPQHSVGPLDVGQEVWVELAASKANSVERMKGRLKWISATADIATRSYAVEAVIKNHDELRLIGLSATLLLPLETVQGHWLPSSALGLAGDGGLSVKTVDADGLVDVVPVSLIRTEENGFWVSGLVAEVNVITLGQDFVGVGEVVEAVPATMISIPENVSVTSEQAEVQHKDIALTEPNDHSLSETSSAPGQAGGSF